MAKLIFSSSWSERDENIDLIAERLTSLLTSLSDVDERLSGWKSVNNAIPVQPGIIKFLQSGKQTKDDLGRTDWPEAGIMVSAATGNKTDYSSFTMTAAAKDVNGNWSNHFTLESHEHIAKGKEIIIFKSIIDAMSPDRATVTNFNLISKLLGDGFRNPLFGMINYERKLTKSSIYYNGVVIEELENGFLIDALSANGSDEAVFQRVAFINDALSGLGKESGTHRP